MNNKFQKIIYCLLLVAEMLTTLSVSAQESKGRWTEFKMDFDQKTPIYAVALKGIRSDASLGLFPTNVFFTDMPNGEKSGYYAVSTAKLTAKIGDKKNVIGHEAMEDIGDGWRMYKFDKPLYIRKYDPNVLCENLMLLVDGAEAPAMASTKEDSSNSKVSNNDEGSKSSDELFSIVYTQPENVEKPDFTTPEAAGYTLLNTKTMSIYKYKCDYFAEGVVRVYFGNGDFATFSDEKVFCNGENDRSPGHNQYSTGDWQLTSEDGYIVKQENGVVSITYPNGCKVINRNGRDLYWDVDNPKPIVYASWFYGDLLEVPSKTEPLKWVMILEKSRNEHFFNILKLSDSTRDLESMIQEKSREHLELMDVSGYMDGDRLYALTTDGQFFPFIQIVEDNIPLPATASDTIVSVQKELVKNKWGNEDYQYTIHYNNDGEVVAVCSGTDGCLVKSGSIRRNGGLFTIKEVNDRIIKTLTFANGDKFIGDVKLQKYGYPMRDSGYGHYELNLTDLAWPELELWNGTMIKANGNRVEYKNGKTEQQIAAERKAEEAKTKAQYNQLCKQFGKKYVDAALASNPIVGMPEELLKRAFTLKLVEEGTSYKLYRISGWGWKDFGSTLSDSATLYSIWVSNGRVTDIRHW